MTLAALLITMAMTCILMGMFLPILVQGLVNIASGKTFDGSVSLSRRNGFFMCYYDNNGRLMQSRADVNPTGKGIDVVTVPASGDGCHFDIPSWPESFRVMLVGAGGAGATPSFEVFDEECDAPENTQCSSSLPLIPEVEGNIVSYSYDNSKENFCLVDTLFKNSQICLSNRVGIELDYSPQEGDIPQSHSLKVNINDKSAEYKIENNVASITSVPSYSMACSNSTTANGYCSVNSLTQERTISSLCEAPSFFLTGLNRHLPIGSILDLSYRCSGLRLNVAEGGKLGEKIERVVPFLEGVNGVLTIPPGNIGRGGRDNINDGKGGDTTLLIPGGSELRAAGGIRGGLVSEEIYDENNMGMIAGVERAGQNGEMDRFIPAQLKIMDLLRGRGAQSADDNAGNASYPGAGGGGGAIRIGAYNESVVRSGDACVAPRVVVNVEGDVESYELECRPNLNLNDFVDIDSFREVSTGGNGADGAILIAW